MSQAKVDRYKQEKANREKTMKKEKMIRRLEGAVGVFVLCLIIAWCGVSVYQKAEEKRRRLSWITQPFRITWRHLMIQKPNDCRWF